MAYSKLAKLKADCGIGFQTFNQVRDNMEQMRDDYLVEHGDGVTGVVLGHHNSPAIARATALVAYPLGVTQPSISWTSDASIIVGVARLSAGYLFASVAGYASMWATVQATSTDPAAVYALLATPGVTTAGLVGVAVQIYQSVAGVMTLTDGVPFSLTVYGYN